LTQDKFDIVQFIPTQIKFLATPLPGAPPIFRSKGYRTLKTSRK